ncbi:MAG TPA: glutamate--tRNA ligase [Clostridiaceae bacterium]|nr:glutamate--tRNA ligase [Clostridiaceae bacterium]
MPDTIVRTRFAPSPTGYMHIGNLRTALYGYLLAKKYNGKFILRIEDTDQDRYVEGAVDVIYKTLALAGIKYDEGPDIGGDYGPYVQSERKEIYMKYALELIEKGVAYYCFCDKKRLESLKVSHEGSEAVLKYDRYCLNLSKKEIEKNLAEKKPFVIRQKMPDTGTTSFTDTVYGTITVNNSELDDQILIKSDGMPTYNFANVIDDHLMGITHVVRGNEYLSSTPKYNLLYEAFGWEIPTYVHLPLILRPTGQKLSKRAGDPSFEDLISMGYLPEAVVNYVALLGWSPGTNQEIFSMDELIEAFSIEGINKAPAVFDMAKLTWMNGEYVRKLPLEKFHEFALKYYKDAGLSENIDLVKVSSLLQPRTEVFNAIPEIIDFLVKLPDYDISLYTHKKMKTNEVNSLENLKAVLPVLEKLEDWNNDTIYGTLTKLAEQLGVKSGQILWPVRVALSGKAATPGGASELAEILGKDETLKRIRIGIEKLNKEV